MNRYKVDYSDIKTGEELREIYNDALVEQLKRSFKKSGMEAEQFCRVLVNRIVERLGDEIHTA